MKDLTVRHENLDSQNFDKIVVSVSGGKDSSVLLAWAVANFPKEKLIAVHAIIDIDWTETMAINRAQCEFFGVPLIEVQAVHADGSKKGFLSILKKGRTDRKTGERKETLFPDMSCRWCTSELKLAPIDKYVRTLSGNILVLIGERAEESSQRAKLESWRPDEKLSKNGRNVIKHSPILQMKETTVWEIINNMGIPKHPCYSWGVSRASCAICIFSSDKEIAIAAERAPDIVREYILTEQKLQHSFRYKQATKTRPEQKISVMDILKKEGVDLQKLLMGELAA